MSKLIFLKNEDKLKANIVKQLKPLFKSGDKIAVKLHFGEPGNTYALKPEFVRKVVDALLELGTKPFLFDTPVAYAGPRHTSKDYYKSTQERGFTPEKVGCPVIISNKSISVKGKIEYQVAKDMVEADGVLVLTHVKGHICTGFGGAIKNIGMGAITKETKGAIHDGGKPVYLKGCTLCEICSQRCPLDNIRYDETRPQFDKNWCCGCSNCALFCPEKSIKPKVATFNFLLSEGAALAIKNFKKTYYVNVLQKISKLCDCQSDGGKIVLDDIGILMSEDIVAVEKATLDLINKKAGKDLFESIHHKTPLEHIKEIEKLGMGSMEYEIV